MKIIKEKAKKAFPSIIDMEGEYKMNASKEAVNHPAYYGGGDNPYEAIKVINAWQMNFQLGSALKYICRAGKKDASKRIEDLEKAAFYLKWEIENLRKDNASG